MNETTASVIPPMSPPTNQTPDNRKLKKLLKKHKKLLKRLNKIERKLSETANATKQVDALNMPPVPLPITPKEAASQLDIMSRLAKDKLEYDLTSLLK